MHNYFLKKVRFGSLGCSPKLSKFPLVMHFDTNCWWKLRIQLFAGNHPPQAQNLQTYPPQIRGAREAQRHEETHRHRGTQRHPETHRDTHRDTPREAQRHTETHSNPPTEQIGLADSSMLYFCLLPKLYMRTILT